MEKNGKGLVVGSGPWCGTRGGYNNHGCRCAACRTANTEYSRQRQATPTVGAGPWCGTAGGYKNHKCRCGPCTDAERAYQRAYREKNRERVRDRDQLRNRKYYEENAAKERERARKYRNENPEAHRVRVEKWKETHPEKTADYSNRRRAVTRGQKAESGITHKWLLKRDDGICQICHRPVDPTKRSPHPRSPSIDHIVPISKGGAHTKANVQLACLRCNQRKHARMSD